MNAIWNPYLNIQITFIYSPLPLKLSPLTGQPTATHRVFIMLGSLIGWFALLGQFYLIIANRVAPIPETLIRYFSYFTILTNIIVAVYFTSWWLFSRSKVHLFLSSASSQAAITLYITVVGIVYQLLLRHIWEPKGFQMIVDELLHTIIPLLAITHWWLFADKQRLTWKHTPKWLLYPLVYLIFILIRGAFSGFYPYPFVDVTQLGYSAVIRNSIGLMFGFLLLANVLVWKSRTITHNKHT